MPPPPPVTSEIPGVRERPQRANGDGIFVAAKLLPQPLDAQSPSKRSLRVRGVLPFVSVAHPRATTSLLLATFLCAGALAADPPIPGNRPACVSVRPEVFQGGPGLYNHLVYVANHCPERVACRVTTNANPTPVAATVAPDHEEMVNTFLNSPARAFVPRVDCEVPR